MWVVEQRKTLQSKWVFVAVVNNCADAQEVARKIGLKNNTYMRISFISFIEPKNNNIPWDANNAGGVNKEEYCFS